MYTHVYIYIYINITIQPLWKYLQSLHSTFRIHFTCHFCEVHKINLQFSSSNVLNGLPWRFKLSPYRECHTYLYQVYITHTFHVSEIEFTKFLINGPSYKTLDIKAEIIRNKQCLKLWNFLSTQQTAE